MPGDQESKEVYRQLFYRFLSNVILSIALLWIPISHSKIKHRPPLEILAELRAIEREILQGIEELEGMLQGAGP